MAVKTTTDKILFLGRAEVEARAYWHAQVDGVFPENIFRRPALLQHARSISSEFTLSRQVVNRLIDLADESQALLHAILLAVAETCAFRYSGQRLLLMGSPTRTVPEAKGKPAVLPIVSRVAPELTLVALLTRLRPQLLEAYEHQSYGYEEFQDRVQLAIRLESIHDPLPSLPNALCFDVRAHTDGSLQCLASASADTMEPEVIGSFTAHFSRLAAALPDHLHTPLWRVPILDDAERQSLLAIGKPSSAEPSHSFCIHELFEGQVARTPNAIAIIAGERQVTYSDLDSQAEAVASILQNLGAAPDMLVALQLERSIDLLIYLLGIWKAGAAYLPLDPDYPPLRIAQILDDCHPALWLKRTDGSVSEMSRCRVLNITGWSLAKNTIRTMPHVHPQNLAYAIVTSGTTGKPKSVIVEHRGVANIVAEQRQLFQAQQGDLVLQTSSISFDASIFEFLMALTSGATLCIESAQGLVNNSNLLFTHVTLTPSVLSVLPNDSLPAARVLVVAGEECRADLVSRWGKGRKMFNAYGPSEASIWSTVWPCDPKHSARPPIGKPLPNTRAHVLDNQFEPMPMGLVGELFVAGTGLARGYNNRPELTAALFVPDPLGGFGERLYRTGDLARLLPDGNIELLGRKDHQVKVHAHRIELEELESVLREHSSVREAAVGVDVHNSGERRLVGYLVFRGEALPWIEVSSWLGKRLPAHMIPGVWVKLAELPRTLAGKLNRSALPAPVTIDIDGSEAAPHTDAEKRLALIWREVLRLENIGIHQNFFALGGDSISSLQIIAKAQRDGLQITVRQLYKHPTISALAVVAQQGGAPLTAQCRVSGPVELTPIQSWFFEQEWEKPWHFNQAIMLEARTPVDDEGLRVVIRTLVEHHDALRAGFLRINGEWRQEILHDVVTDPLAIEFTRDSCDLENRATGWQARFDLAAGLLFRAVLFHTEGHHDRVLLIGHHLVIDAVSWRVLLEDLESGYAQWLRGESKLRFPRKTAAFQTWAQQLRRLASDTELAADRRYWESQCLGHESGPQPLGQVGSVIVSLNQEETEALLRDLHSAFGTQVNDVLLTALLEVLGRDGKLTVALEGHGRDNNVGLDVSRTVGWFTTQFPVRLEVNAGLSLREKLISVQQQLRAIPRDGIGYGLLRWMAPGGKNDDKLQFSPSVSFNYLGQLDGALANDGLFSISDKSVGDTRIGPAQAPYSLNIDAAAWGGQLRLTWTFRDACWTEQDVSERASAYLEALRMIVRLGRESTGRTLAPSAFPLAGLSQTELDRILSRRVDIQDIYPLSPTQQGLLFHNLLEPDSNAYHAQISCLLLMRETEVWEEAVGKVVQRHPILRTSFCWEGLSSPLQIVHRKSSLVIEKMDWRSLSGKDANDAFATLREADLTRRFDLSHPSPMRLTLLRESDDHVRCLWSFHHLLLDGWSGALLLGEVAECYNALLEKRCPRLAEVVPYKNYIGFCLTRQSGEAESFWRQYLRHYGEPAELIDLRPLKNTPDEYASRRVTLSRKMSNQLRSFSSDYFLTLSTIFRAAWAIVLACYSGKRDVVFGATVADRDPGLPNVERIVGLLINTIPVRVRLSGGVTICALLQKLQTDMQEQVNAPLSQINSWSELPSGTPLFESILVFENYPLGAPVQNSATASDISFENRTNFPLTVEVQPENEIRIRASFDQQRFTTDVVQSMLDALLRALSNLLENSSRPIAMLPLLGESETHKLVRQWNSSTLTWNSSLVIHKLFTAQCERTPDHIAVVASGARLTYAELDDLSNRLSQSLISRGVRQGSLVGLCVERGAELVISALAILKTGAAYIPVEPSHPLERLRWVVQDAQLRIIIANASSEQCLANLGCEVLLVDRAEEWQTFAPANHSLIVNEHDAAYVIYTSGSTGKPKGVIVTHAAVVNYVRAMRQVADLDDGMSWAMVQPLSVDSSVTALYPPLLSGGTVHVIATELLSESVALNEYLRRERVDCLKIAPSHLSALDDVMPSKRLIVGGEASEALWAKELLEKRSGCRIWNHYGPTEATVGMLTYEVTADFTARRGGTVPIGRPLPNTRAYVLDEEMEMVPIGVKGELYIAGDCLARGYLNRAELTAERFVPDRCSSDGERMYRTGDLARFLQNGDIEFLGRADQQVKIRGHRIETGEIEAALRNHPGVREAIVEARERKTGDKRLVAYVVPSAQSPTDSNELKDWLKCRLPKHMIPSAWVEMQQLPRSIHGKLDRRALPTPIWTGTERLPSEPAANDIESKLIQIWREVIEVTNVGRHDNFFDLGGDSIHSIQIVARSRNEGIHITVKQVFENQTIAGLAAVAALAAVPLAEQHRIQGPAELTPIQRWFFEQDWQELWHFNQSVLVESEQPLNEDALRAVLRDLVDYHDALRTRFEYDGNGWKQEIVDQVPQDSLFVELVGSTAELEQRATHWQTRFLLNSGLLFRAVLFRMPGIERDRLLLIAHHLVVDGVSWRVLLQDLVHAYRQWGSAELVTLPRKTASFQDWAIRLRERVADVEVETRYWEDQSIESAFSPRPGMEQNLRAQLGEEETRALLQELRGVYRTQVNDVLLTALLDALGAKELLVEMEGHGRDERFGLDLSRSLGWFTVHYPVRLTALPHLSIGDRLRSIKEQLRRVPGTGIGFGMLRYLGRDENVRRRLQYRADVSFNYLGQLDSVLPQDGPLRLAAESPGQTESSTIRRNPTLRLSTFVLNGRLQILWAKCGAADIVNERFVNALREIINHCRQADAGGFTPSDFPDVEFSQRELDDLISELGTSPTISGQ